MRAGRRILPTGAYQTPTPPGQERGNHRQTGRVRAA